MKLKQLSYYINFNTHATIEETQKIHLFDISI